MKPFKKPARPHLGDYSFDSERLRFVMAASGLSAGAFAQLIGLPDSELLYRIKYEQAPLGPQLVRRIHACFSQIDAGWLLTGKVGDGSTQNSIGSATDPA